MDLFSNLRPRGSASPCNEIHPEGNTVDVAAQAIHLQGRPTLLFVYLWAEEVRDKPQSIAEFWLFISIFASCEEAAQLGNVAQRGGLRVIGQTARWIIVILSLLAFLAGLGVDFAHKNFLVNALDPSSSEDPDACHILTMANTILIGVSIGVYGVMTVAGIYGTTIALGLTTVGDAKYHSGIHKYRRYSTVLIVAFLARSMLGLAFIMVFDWFNMEPYDLFCMVYAIVYAANTAVMFFCIASLIRIPNPMTDEELQ
ncbi:uncharacterized protein A1O5_09493 [Cladophialophora psammophila CBS 110553]|uniref:Uncharacterized protein n=1 Tax=Cladophialophora psammophila CBS 110553 TaxID=1182543 RepID=W9WR67_9EURO|nr:uncharacterized protein A1O5_09493 [Cladophialophora psammophila CBS 110553]EXJ67480.1 hypothetical protein A1O5_09493 [Cladophialophora psammophila CBS 110553]